MKRGARHARGSTATDAAVAQRSRYADSVAVSVSLIRFASIAMPGPIVVEIVSVLTYLPLAADGRARRISSTTDEVVLEQLLLGERLLPDDHVDVPRPVGLVLDLAALDLLHGLADVVRHRAGLRVRHEPSRTEDAPGLADRRHHVRRRDRRVEVDVARHHLLDEVLAADDVGAGLLGLGRLRSLRERGDPDRLARCRSEARPSHAPSGRPCADRRRAGRRARRSRRTSRPGIPSASAIASAGRYSRSGSTALRGLRVPLAVAAHGATSTPMLRAVPAMIFIAGLDVVRVQVHHLLLGDPPHLVLR